MYHQKPVPTKLSPFSIKFQYHPKSTITSPNEPLKSNTNQSEAILSKFSVPCKIYHYEFK